MSRARTGSRTALISIGGDHASAARSSALAPALARRPPCRLLCRERARQRHAPHGRAAAQRSAAVGGAPRAIAVALTAAIAPVTIGSATATAVSTATGSLATDPSTIFAEPAEPAIADAIAAALASAALVPSAVQLAPPAARRKLYRGRGGSRRWARKQHGCHGRGIRSAERAARYGAGLGRRAARGGSGLLLACSARSSAPELVRRLALRL